MMRTCPARRVFIAGALTSAFASTVPTVRAQTTKPIRLIVPFTPGGTTDIVARAIAPKLALALGQTVVIENKPGAGGSLGAAEVARAEPDGLTLLMGHIGTLAVNPSIYPKLAYDPIKSFAPVAWVVRVPNVLWCTQRRRSRPWRSSSNGRAANRASSVIHRVATAVRRTSPSNISSCAPRFLCCTFLTAARRLPSPI